MKRISTLLTTLLVAIFTFGQLGYGTALTQNDFNNSSTVFSKNSYVAWAGSDGIRCGEPETGVASGPAWNWDYKSFVVAINPNGIPASVSFEYKKNNFAATGSITLSSTAFKVEESADGSSWKELFNDAGSTEWTSKSVSLSTTTHYLRMGYKGNFAGFFRNVTVNERIEITPTVNAIDFDTVYVDDVVPDQSLDVNWINVEASVSGQTSPISVNPTSFGSIAQTGTATLTFSLNTNQAGDYEQTVTISGRNKSAEIAVSAVVFKHNQTITWTPASTTLLSNATISASAIASSGLDVEYTSTDTSVINMIDNVPVIVGVGNASVLVNQEGNYKYNAAPTIQVDFTIHPAVTYSTAEGLVCPGSTYEFLDSAYAAGEHAITIANVYGGDSVITLTVTERPTYFFADSHGFNMGEIYTWHGRDLTAAGIYYDSLTTIHGCDSVYELTLTVNPTYSFSENDAICQGGTYTWHGRDLTAAGIYYDSLTTIHGCDSVYELTLTVNPTYFFSENDAICQGGTYTWHGRDLTAAGIYYDSLTTIHGCDSVYELTLTVNPTYFFSENDAICQGEIYTWHDRDLTAAGIYYDSLTTIHGCDSVYELTLTVNPTYFFTDTMIVTYGDLYMYAGMEGGEDVGTYVRYDTMQTIAGCDSIEEHILVVLPAAQSITWTLNETAEYTEGDIIVLDAEATSGLEVEYSVEPAMLATIEDNVLTLVQEGELTISAMQAGDNNYLAADPMQKTITILPLKDALEDIFAPAVEARKIIYHGQFFILHNGVLYDAQGVVVK